MQPRRPQVHLAPSISTTTWPISPAAPRPTQGCPSRISPPPTPVPQKTPSSELYSRPAPSSELGHRRHPHVVAERHRAAEQPFELGAERRSVPSQPGRLRALVTSPPRTVPGEPTPTPASSAGSISAAAAASRSACSISRGDVLGAARGRRRAPGGAQHVVVLVDDRRLDLRAAEVDAPEAGHGRLPAAQCGRRRVGDRRGAGLGRHRRERQRLDAPHQRFPLRGAQRAAAEVRRGAAARRPGARGPAAVAGWAAGWDGGEDELDVVPVDAAGLRVGRLRVAHQAEDFVRARTAAGSVSSVRIVRSVIEPGPWWWAILTPLMAEMSDRAAVVGGRQRAAGGVLGLPAAQRADRRLEPAACQERDHGQRALVDQAAGDVAPAAAVDRDFRDRRGSRAAAASATAATRRWRSRRAAGSRPWLPRGAARPAAAPSWRAPAPDRSWRSRPPAGSRSAGCPALASGSTVTCAEHGPGGDDRALAQRLAGPRRAPGGPARRLWRRRPRARRGCPGARTGVRGPSRRAPPRGPPG